MKLTPLDIHQKEFRRGLRGYNEEDVDSFLDEIATEFEKLFQENIDLREQVERLQKKLAQYENFEQTLQDTMLASQKSAEEIQNNAKRAAELIIRDAELKAKEIVQDALSMKQEVNQEFASSKKIALEFREKFKALTGNFTQMMEDFKKEEAKIPDVVIEEAKEEELGEAFREEQVEERPPEPAKPDQPQSRKKGRKKGRKVLTEDEQPAAENEEAIDDEEVSEEVREDEEIGVEAAVVGEEKSSEAEEIIRKTLETLPEED
ncbi:MAG: DivIVA domain-containing protein [Actinomycetia bacterium]|nr:DivIVA domain-containing protein [Actinomycetes bacterium]